MLVNIASKPFVIVLLDSLGKYTRIADAQRVKHWLETGESLVIAAPKAPRLSRPGRANARTEGSSRASEDVAAQALNLALAGRLGAMRRLLR